MTAIVRSAYGTAWVTMALLTTLATLATTLAGVGIHAALSHDVARRRREIGIRLALGAERGVVARRVLAAGMLPAVVGVAAGAGVAALGGTLLDTLLFGISRSDPRIFVLTALTVLTAAAAAAAVPALRAASLPPAHVLNED